MWAMIALCFAFTIVLVWNQYELADNARVLRRANDALEKAVERLIAVRNQVRRLGAEPDA